MIKCANTVMVEAHILEQGHGFVSSANRIGILCLKSKPIIFDIVKIPGNGRTSFNAFRYFKIHFILR